jgi:hypothetical protein
VERGNVTTRKCLFCGSAQRLSKEHIIPQWLLRELGLTDQQLMMSHTSVFGVTKSQRTHRFMRLVNAMVCKKCNSGWMSALEVSVQDSITKLMHLDDRSAIRSLAEDYKTIAKWSFKTAIMLNYPTNYRRIVPEEHFHSLYQSGIPEGVYINLAFTENTDIVVQWRQSQTIITIGDQGHAIPPKDVYKITMQFKHLLLRVCYISFNGFVQGDNEASIALWPQFGRYEDFQIYDNIDEFDTGNYFIQI